MNQKVRESLSALMDGECSEFETRRVLKSLSEDAPEEADTWRRYHLMRSIMQRDNAIDVSTDLSASIRARLEQEHMEDAEPGQETHRRTAPFSFMGSAAIAAAVSLMVMTGVQVYRANTGVDSVPGNGGGTSLASRDTTIDGSGAMSGSDGAMASLAAFRGTGGDAGSNVMPIGAQTSWFMAPGEEDAARNDRQQVEVLQNYLNRHVEQAGYRSNVWMANMQGLAPASGE
ncbi:sigma-E factor negative regulatory protein [Kushneria indalinina]|uniref:Sigma-E factor negative regulatory protein RseA n=1 Tax=Kushneria indalinina DSM 14324 TaxID=1122140 RepID=A0A3D9DZL9_9GAMM|nr:sigma-E factor negative regulatory protein [Kushneria indalinina]REC96105.1 sigma-E factor negative regulatory protein RseA [Kushneria indalinina DSM 14324]